MKKQVFMILLSLALVSSISITGTLAYMTDRDSIANVFTVGNIDITLDEADVDEKGHLILDAEGKPVDRVTENEYHLIPGQTYIKDPTITVNENSEESYIRMIMTVHNASAVQEIIHSQDLADFSDLIAGWDENVWLYEDFTEDKENNTISLEFRYHKSVSGKPSSIILEPLFQKLVVPEGVTGAELAKLNPNNEGDENDQFKIVLQGHAIQKATFEDAESAWNAFDQQVSQ